MAALREGGGGEFLHLAPLAKSTFVADQADWWCASERAFGGQLVAHCLYAAGSRYPSFAPHSVHVSFVAPARMVRTEYTVQTVRDGRTFVLAHVLGRQGVVVVVQASVGLQRTVAGAWPGGGVLHAALMPDVPGPLSCAAATMDAWRDSKAAGLASMRWEVRPVPGRQGLCWMSWTAPLGVGSLLHAAALAFLSDLQFLWCAYWPHEGTHDLTHITSLDHALHLCSADLDATSWLLMHMESPFAGHERGYVTARVWDGASGRLVACVAQEGVLRTRSKL